MISASALASEWKTNMASKISDTFNNNFKSSVFVRRTFVMEILRQQKSICLDQPIARHVNSLKKMFLRFLVELKLIKITISINILTQDDSKF